MQLQSLLLVSLTFYAYDCVLMSVAWPGTSIVEVKPTGGVTTFGSLDPPTLTWYQSLVLGDEIILVSCAPDNIPPLLGRFNIKTKVFKTANITGTPIIDSSIACAVTANPSSTSEIYFSSFSGATIPTANMTTIYTVSLATAKAKKLGSIRTNQVANTGIAGSWVDPITMTLTIAFNEYIGFPWTEHLNVLTWDLKGNSGNFYHHLNTPDFLSPTGFTYSASRKAAIGIMGQRNWKHFYIAEWDAATHAFKPVFELDSTAPCLGRVALYTPQPETVYYFDCDWKYIVTVDLATKSVTKADLKLPTSIHFLYDLLEVNLSVGHM
eukprot:TRINITY_DN67865_c10_g1_i3.p1 TRINITY_DN67865_c10_g1~~TRINITY_DN67865_c10_g1_i3.p1  ORF type:complete len:323 (+),score=40.16 TRINITY_DN67865_c10_g1_i3:51-1019(+)